MLVSRSRFFASGIAVVRRCSTSSTSSNTSPTEDLLKRELYFGNRVARLLLNSPKKRNALSLELIETLHKELTEMDKIEKLRAVILAHEGPAFSAGHDLRQLTTDKGVDYHREVFARCTQMLTLIQSMKLPVIAEVRGVAAAAGCQLVASCDVVVAGRSAKFSVPGLKVGLFCSTPGIPLTRAVPRKVALDMLLTGEAIDAEALRAGLVSRVVDDDQVKFEALKVAEQITTMSRSVTALGKSFFYAQVQLPAVDAYRQGERVMVDNLRYKDAQEGIEAFIGKRQPNWSHGEDRVN